MADDYNLTFASKDGGKTFTRNLYGLEGMIATMAQKADGFGAFDGGGVFSFPRPVSKESLKEAVEACWIRLRRTVPIIALKTFPLPNQTDYHYYQYEVPSDEVDAKEWAHESVIWHDAVMSVHDRDQMLKNSYWKPGEGHYNYELHVAPDIEEGKWQFIMHAAHWSIDTRGLLQFFGIFLRYLNQYIVEGKPFSTSGAWGEETKHFSPASVVISAKNANMDLSSLFPKAQPAKVLEDANAPEPPPAPFMFLRSTTLLDPKPKNSQHSYDIWLSEMQTAMFREACRKRGLTATQATTALMSLAELEWAMTFPMNETDEQKKATIKNYKEATHLPSIWNIVDQRLKMGEFSSHEGEKGSPTLGVDGFPLMMDMSVLRQVVNYDEATGQIMRKAKENVFWDLVVPMCRESWKANDMSWPGHVQREIGSQQMIPLFVGEVYMIPSLLSSSIGDIERCGLMTHVSPLIRRQREAKGETLEDHILMDQFSLSVRTPTPLKMVLVWQWNGRMMLRLHSSAKWTTEEGMKKFGKIFSDWIDLVA